MHIVRHGVAMPVTPNHKSRYPNITSIKPQTQHLTSGLGACTAAGGTGSGATPPLLVWKDTSRRAAPADPRTGDPGVRARGGEGVGPRGEPGVGANEGLAKDGLASALTDSLVATRSASLSKRPRDERRSSRAALSRVWRAAAVAAEGCGGCGKRGDSGPKVAGPAHANVASSASCNGWIGEANRAARSLLATARLHHPKQRSHLSPLPLTLLSSPSPSANRGLALAEMGEAPIPLKSRALAPSAPRPAAPGAAAGMGGVAGLSGLPCAAGLP